MAILIGKVMMINHLVLGAPCSQTNPFVGGVKVSNVSIWAHKRGVILRIRN